MQSEHKKFGRRFWGRWILVTTIGWSVGIITAFIVAHLVAPIVYIVIPHETNLVFGLCLGAVVGYTQRRYAPNPITASGRLALSTTIGMGIPFVVVVIVACSPKPDPGVMSVSTAPSWGQETHDEEEAAFAGSNHPEAA